MTQNEIIRMAREACAPNQTFNSDEEWVKRFADLVAAHVKSDQINTAYQQGCEDMKRRMEKRMQQLESQLQLCQTAVANEREACAKVCDEIARRYQRVGTMVADGCAAAIRARNMHSLLLIDYETLNDERSSRPTIESTRA